MLGERLAVECICEEGLRSERLVARQAATVLLLNRVLLRAELDFFSPLVSAEEHDLARVRFQPRGIEHGLERHAGPTPVADQSLQRPSITRALEPSDEL